MSKKTSLENYALFYEKLETSTKPATKQDTSYEKAPYLTDEQIKALREDLQKPADKSNQQRTS